MDVSHHQSAAKGMVGCCSFPFLFRFEVSPSAAAAAALVKKVDGDDDAPELCAAAASSSLSVSGGALNALHDAGISDGGGATEQVVLSPQMRVEMSMQTHMSKPPLVEI